MSNANKKMLNLVGLIPDRRWLPPAAAALIEEADVLAGGDRLLELFPDAKGLKFRLRPPLSGWLEELKGFQDQGQKVTVLASGDPNYFGLAKKLLEVVGPEMTAVHPSPTVAQQAFARLKTSWEATETVSLHGRDAQTAFWSALFRAGQPSGSGYLAVYTDPANTPAVIARRLLERGQPNWRLNVFENLGAPDERHTAWTLDEAGSRDFQPLNLVVLECLGRPAPAGLGRPESAYHHEAGLITKREVRVTALGLMELQPGHILWDLGAGSGSVSIEAAALLTHGAVWAVEKSPRRAEQIRLNRSFFGAAQLEVVAGEALAAMDQLPPPDRVFLGGGGAGLAGLIRAAAAKLRPRGLMLASVVSLDALAAASAGLREAGLELSVTQLQAARSEPLGGGLYLKPLNQVWLVRGDLR